MGNGFNAASGAAATASTGTSVSRVASAIGIATSASWCIMHASVLYFSLSNQHLALHPLLIALFLAITVPVTTIFLMRAGLFRARQAGQQVPPNISREPPTNTKNS